MATYRLTIKRNDTQVQVISSSNPVIEYELDRYLECFVNRKISNEQFLAKKDVTNNCVAQQNATNISSDFHVNSTKNVAVEKKQACSQMSCEQHKQYTSDVQEMTGSYTSVEQNKEVYTNKPTQECIQTQREQQALISLKDFLVSNKATDTFSEFIISAYYIKRVLNIPHFTLKMINAKFYPIANALIDLSIINEARTRGFVESIEEDGVAKYTLTPAGESYFINQLRG